MLSEPIATILFKNRSHHPVMIRRAKSGVEIPLAEFGIMGLKLYKKDAFISFDGTTIVVEFGADE